MSFDDLTRPQKVLAALFVLIVSCWVAGCTTEPSWVERRVTVCVADFATGEAICQERLCRYHTGTGEYDCLNRPVVG